MGVPLRNAVAGFVSFVSAPLADTDAQKLTARLCSICRLPQILIRGSLKHWARSAAEAAQMLHAVAGSSEGDFLSLGKSLAEYSQQAAVLSKRAETVARQMAGPELDEVARRFSQLATLTEDQRQQADANCVLIHELQDIFRQLRRPVDDFDRIIKTLHVLAIYSRIENAVLDTANSGFDALANNIQQLSSSMRAKTDDVVRRINVLKPQLLDAVAMLEQSRDTLHSQVRDMLAGIRASVEQLETCNRGAAEAVQGVAEQYRQVQGSISQIVTSLQFHDITRQKLEHAGDALQSAAGVLADRSLLRLVVRPRKALSHMGQYAGIARLQAAQVEGAVADMDKALDVVTEQLQQIGRSVVDMGATIQRVAGDDPSADRSFLTGVGDDLERVAVSLQVLFEMRENVAATITTVAHTIADVAPHIADIQGIGLEVKRIALNAQIRAARLGGAGAALGELSEEIQTIWNDTAGITGTMTAAFEEIVTLTSKLNDGQRDADGGTAISNQMRAMIDNWRSGIMQLDVRVREDVSAIHQQGEALAAALERTIGSISVHSRMHMAVDPVVADMRAIGGVIGGFCPAVATDSEALTDLEQTYTMESERIVHRAALSADADSDADVWTTAAEDNSPAAQDDEFGDNVELF